MMNPRLLLSYVFVFPAATVHSLLTHLYIKKQEELLSLQPVSEFQQHLRFSRFAKDQHGLNSVPLLPTARTRNLRPC